MAEPAATFRLEEVIRERLDVVGGEAERGEPRAGLLRLQSAARASRALRRSGASAGRGWRRQDDPPPRGTARRCRSLSRRSRGSARAPRPRRAPGEPGPFLRRGRRAASGRCRRRRRFRRSSRRLRRSPGRGRAARRSPGAWPRRCRRARPDRCARARRAANRVSFSDETFSFSGPLVRVTYQQATKTQPIKLPITKDYLNTVEMEPFMQVW